MIHFFFKKTKLDGGLYCNQLGWDIILKKRSRIELNQIILRHIFLDLCDCITNNNIEYQNLNHTCSWVTESLKDVPFVYNNAWIRKYQMWILVSQGLCSSWETERMLTVSTWQQKWEKIFGLWWWLVLSKLISFSRVSETRLFPVLAQRTNIWLHSQFLIQ